VIHGLNVSIGIVIFGVENAGAAAMLVACRLAALSPRLRRTMRVLTLTVQMLDRLARPGESYSDVILRLVKASSSQARLTKPWVSWRRAGS
jgi:hypothetical protein